MIVKKADNYLNKGVEGRHKWPVSTNTKGKLRFGTDGRFQQRGSKRAQGILWRSHGILTVSIRAVWDALGTSLGSLFVIVRDSGSFLGNPWPQNTSSEHPKNNPPPRLPPKWTPRCTFGLQDVPKMAQARPKAQKNIKNEYGNDPKATQSESLDKKHPDRRHRPQGLFNTGYSYPGVTSIPPDVCVVVCCWTSRRIQSGGF